VIGFVEYVCRRAKKEGNALRRSPENVLIDSKIAVNYSTRICGATRIGECGYASRYLFTCILTGKPTASQ
jgi:hypothetical protein